MCLLSAIEKAVWSIRMMTPRSHQKRQTTLYKLKMIFGTGFLAVLTASATGQPRRKETARFPGEPAQQTDQPPAGFVSMIMCRDA